MVSYVEDLDTYMPQERSRAARGRSTSPGTELRAALAERRRD